VSTTIVSNPTPPPYSPSLDSIGADPVDMGVGYLTPDALMAYCQSRLRSIDGQIRSGIDRQNNSNTEQQLIAELNTTLQSLAADGTTNPPTKGNAPNNAQCVRIEQQFDDVISKIRAIDPNSPVLGQLEKIHDNIMATGALAVGTKMHGYYGTPDGAIASDDQIDSQEIGVFLKDLESANTTVNSSSELQMIQLQSYMSQRQTAIQLTTNLVQSLGDQVNKIADNIGH